MRPTPRTLAILAITAAAVGAMPSTARASTPRVAAAPLHSAQVLAPGWTKAKKEEGRVDDLIRVGSRVYLGGNFTVVRSRGGTAMRRMYLASVLTANGALGTWHPKLNGRVYALAASPAGKFLYVAGDFTTVNGQPRHHLAAFKLSTGKLASRIPDLRISGSVKALAATSTSLYLGGSFGAVAGHARGHLAKLLLTRSGRFRLGTWAPAVAGGEVRDVVVDSAHGRVIAGGTFRSVNRHATNRLAAMGQKRGRVKPWRSYPTDDILDLTIAGNRLYAAEAGPGGTALAYGLRRGGLVWYYKTDGNVQAVGTVKSYPVFGMHGDYVAPRRNVPLSEYGTSARIQRHKLFMLSPRGVLQPWNPNLSSTAGVLGVWSLRGSQGNVYVGGDFTAVHGVSQQRFAILPGR
jgi:hypothetical protein